MTSSFFKNGLLQGRVAIVTGGATGIGRAITEELLRLGCSVRIASRDEEKLRQATERMAKQYHNVSFMRCNIRITDDVKSLVSSTIKDLGRLDYLVNNGGGQFIQPAKSITPKGWNAVVDTNLTGTFFMCQEAFNQWMEKHGGSIVNITMDTYRGNPFMSHSGAARAGVENLTKTLAVEWAEAGVRVNAVAPGNLIYSPTAAKHYSSPNIFEKIVEFLPSKRLGVPEEISPAVVFLLSDAASLISGQVLGVDAASRYYSRLLKEIPPHDRWPKPPTSSTSEAADEETVKSKL